MSIVVGSGGGTSGRAMAFCLDRPGLNPGLDFGFFQFRIAVNLFSLGVGLFLITCNRTVHTLPPSFVFPIIIYIIVKIINCKLSMYQEKLKINPKRGRERPIFKKSVSILYFIFPQKWQMQQHLELPSGLSSKYCPGLCFLY